MVLGQSDFFILQNIRQMVSQVVTAPYFLSRACLRAFYRCLLVASSWPLLPWIINQRPSRPPLSPAREHGCQMAIAKCLYFKHLFLRAWRTMAPLRCAENLTPSFPWIGPHALHPGAIKGKEGIKFCHLATLSNRLSALVLRDRLEIEIQPPPPSPRCCPPSRTASTTSSFSSTRRSRSFKPGRP